ncbi:4'-phosphopantetheinyl transferase family protein [Pedobacter frigoris]|uniref:4-phosphopantetheinyl transferase family protein n=1 Tax=Pedobacter frigoris TaxID=2571272 RepID=A0A4U1CMN0_9SPHI|nr:4'-phosphopantetheinyl transferase superfamily protein [Pedobacter frigoris]TKC09137.1 4-phosphopantetheinyl transferase family protein [Pedobacter frigoris]
MIGNDIVDLDRAARDSNWQRKGYLNKLFTASEQYLIASAPDASIMVWLLWSMKESAYKINSRKTGLRSFAPVKLICDSIIINEHNATGSVSYEGEWYYTRSEFNDAYVHTIASCEQEELQAIKIQITGFYSDYKSSMPQCVSHHGNYLALTYL